LKKVVGSSAVNYTFRPMTIQDFAMARRWLETPEVRRWWSDPDGEVSLLEEDLDDPRIRMWIVFLHDQPFSPTSRTTPLRIGRRTTSHD
jgi:aminoglycoside 6'-N-acetyltransferase